MPFNPAEPSANLYGLFPSAYAQSLATTTGDPTADAINRLNLGQHARGDGGLRGYEDLIRNANEMGYRAEMGAQQKDRDVAWLNNFKAMIEAGAISGVHPGEATGLGIDPQRLASGDAAAIAAQRAARFKTLGEGANQFAQADQQVPGEYIQGVMADDYSRVIPPAPKSFVTTENKAKATQAEADMVSAKAAQQRAANGEGSSKDYVETEDVFNPFTRTWERAVKRRIYGRGGGGAAPAGGAAMPPPTTTKREPKFIQTPQGLKPNPKYKG